MTKSIEVEGSTVDEAVEAALDELGADRDSVEVEVLDEGSKGFFGRINTAKARVRVSLKAERARSAVTLLKDIMEHLGAEGEIAVAEDEEKVRVDITGPRVGMLIGKKGETLAALQTLANVVMRKDGSEKRIELDIERYRERRIESLKEIAMQAAEKAVRQGRPVVLEPMNSYERRMVHVALQDNDRVQTVSEGEEPARKVRIAPR